MGILPKVKQAIPSKHWFAANGALRPLQLECPRRVVQFERVSALSSFGLSASCILTHGAVLHCATAHVEIAQRWSAGVASAAYSDAQIGLAALALL